PGLRPRGVVHRLRQRLPHLLRRRDAERVGTPHRSAGGLERLRRPDQRPAPETEPDVIAVSPDLPVASTFPQSPVEGDDRSPPPPVPPLPPAQMTRPDPLVRPTTHRPPAPPRRPA